MPAYETRVVAWECDMCGVTAFTHAQYVNFASLPNGWTDDHSNPDHLRPFYYPRTYCPECAVKLPLFTETAKE